VDPFFEQGGARQKMQALFPTKEEFVFGKSLAIASVNFHHDFFGHRCQINLKNGEAAYTGCLAFGIERCLLALLELYKSPSAIIDVLASRHQ
jgi:hypothetical protein